MYGAPPVLAAIARKMAWGLVDAKVDLHGYLTVPRRFLFSYGQCTRWTSSAGSTVPRRVYPEPGVVARHHRAVDAHGTGTIWGNGRAWWEYYTTHTKTDGDGRAIRDLCDPGAAVLVQRRHGVARRRIRRDALQRDHLC
ncbi:hypothetical protein B0H10DRAFT_1957304 [Mycena sp. CBHHK59/15]|nr:hypothetical protein B0H10DRAFT_1957304 [Mycena sp. CBHHK59/15]